MRDELELDSEERIKAFTHPYRMKLLHALRRLGRPSTATEVARLLGDGPGKAHYHMRILEAAGIVVLDHTDTVNGIIARYYEPAARQYSVQGGPDQDDDGSLRDELSRMIARRFKEGLKAFLERTLSAESAAGGEPGGAKNDEQGFLFDYTLHCDDASWREVRKALDDLAARYAAEAPGTQARRLFIAGATDRPASAPPAYWTFGLSLSGAPQRRLPPEPPLG